MGADDLADVGPEYAALAESDDDEGDSAILILSDDDCEDSCPFPALVLKCAGLPPVDVRLQGELSKNWSCKDRLAILRGDNVVRKRGSNKGKKKGKKAAAKKKAAGKKMAAGKKAAAKKATDQGLPGVMEAAGMNAAGTKSHGDCGHECCGQECCGQDCCGHHQQTVIDVAPAGH